MERRINQYQQLLKDVSSYDEIVRCKVREMRLFEDEFEIKNTKISNVVKQNQKLIQKLSEAEEEILNLKQLVEAMSDLKDCDASVSDIEIISQLVSKNSSSANSRYQTHKNTHSVALTARSQKHQINPQQNNTASDLASIKLFKKLTTLKKEKTNL